MQAPEFCFLRPAPLHPHIYSNGAAPPRRRPARGATRRGAHGSVPRACAGHICLDILYDTGAWSPALTVASVARSLQSMLLTSPARERPPGDDAYCSRVGNASSRHTRWTFHDDRV